MMTISRPTLQQDRARYQPELPDLLKQLNCLCFKPGDSGKEGDEIKKLFPFTVGRPLLHGVLSKERGSREERVGVVFSGGQAAGGHNVIAGLYDALQQIHPGSRLFGFLGGPSGILTAQSVELTQDKLRLFRNQGGFDLIGSGRTKIETPEHLQTALKTIQALELTGLVIIGGDDSNTNAALLAEYFLANGSQTAVVGVPKTIDGDLKNSYVATSFGFDTACKVYAEMIGNIARDALSAKKYTHFIKLMGRSASHIALECALQVQPNLTLIGEEIAQKKTTLKEITDAIADLVIQRSLKGKEYGVILIPEGLIEFIPEIQKLIEELNLFLSTTKTFDPSQLSQESQTCFDSLPESIRKQLLLTRDPHGNVQVSLIETERLLIETVSCELDRRKKLGTFQGKFSPQGHFFGYEGRAAFPSNFDATYCYTLGHVAALLIREQATGTMCYVSHLTRPVSEWEIGGLPLTRLLNLEMRKGKLKPVIQKALVDLDGKAFSFFKRQRSAWAVDDAYIYPGPIQFSGDKALTDSVPLSLTLS